MGFFDKCYKCIKRYPGCQNTCEHGIKAKNALNERNEKIRKAKNAEHEKNYYIAKHYEKVRKK